MSDEIEALQSNHTWGLVLQLLSMNVVGSRWVFCVKCDANGSLERYKARLVAKGFHQRDGEDYNLTYSLVVKASTNSHVCRLQKVIYGFNKHHMHGTRS